MTWKEFKARIDAQLSDMSLDDSVTIRYIDIDDTGTIPDLIFATYDPADNSIAIT